MKYIVTSPGEWKFDGHNLQRTGCPFSLWKFAITITRSRVILVSLKLFYFSYCADSILLLHENLITLRFSGFLTQNNLDTYICPKRGHNKVRLGEGGTLLGKSYLGVGVGTLLSSAEYYPSPYFYLFIFIYLYNHPTGPLGGITHTIKVISES